jgi:hypothetical protein
VSPLASVLAAFERGATSLSDVAHTTGLDRDVVDAAVEHLVRMGRLHAGTLSTGCPTGGCGSCASGDDDAPGCGSTGPSDARTGPVLVTLSLRRPA